jgi:hypothetical protein
MTYDQPPQNQFQTQNPISQGFPYQDPMRQQHAIDPNAVNRRVKLQQLGIQSELEK